MTHINHISGIYALTHIPSGKVYVGSGKSIGHRKRDHLSGLRRGVHYCPAMQAAFTADGESAFTFTVLEEVPPDKAALFAAEQRWIDHFQATDPAHGFNTNLDARAGRYGRPISETHKAQLRVKMRGNKNGVGHHHGQLTEQDVLQIKQRLAEGERQADLAKAFHVTHATIARIANRETWWHLSLSPEQEARIDARRLTAHQGRGNAKLTAADIPAIRVRLAAGESCASIARAYEVTPGTISHIKHGLVWSHVT